jgi:hypothetical protein
MIRQSIVVGVRARNLSVASSLTAIPAMRQKSGVFLTRDGVLAAIRTRCSISQRGLLPDLRRIRAQGPMCGDKAVTRRTFLNGCFSFAPW